MSTKRDEVRSSMEKIGVFSEESSYNPHDSCHLYDSWTSGAGAVLVRRAMIAPYRHWSGREWQSPEEAFEVTKDHIRHSMRHLCAVSYVFGELTQEKKLSEEDFTPGWVEKNYGEAEGRARELLLDYDLSIMLDEYIVDILQKWASSIAIQMMPVEIVYKVWDMYWLCGGGFANQLFVTGYESGRERSLKDEFDNIISQWDS